MNAVRRAKSLAERLWLFVVRRRLSCDLITERGVVVLDGKALLGSGKTELVGALNLDAVNVRHWRGQFVFQPASAIGRVSRVATSQRPRRATPKNAKLIPRREGFTLSIICGAEAAGYRLSGGRPERATRTPVNIGN